jgi:hypothetical protein
MTKTTRRSERVARQSAIWRFQYYGQISSINISAAMVLRITVMNASIT